MQQRIGAGGLVTRDGKLLCIRTRYGTTSLWLPPGGKIEQGEDALSAAVRETWEEAGVRVTPIKVAVIQDLPTPRGHLAKYWVLCSDDGGEPSVAGLERQERGRIRKAAFVSREQAQREGCVGLLKDPRFWGALEAGFPELMYFGRETA